jgi:hypothetical protein
VNRSDDVPPVRVFISHGWEYSSIYRWIVNALNAALAEWQDVSIPVDRPEDIVARAVDSRKHQAALLRRRASDAENELVALERRQTSLERRMTACQTALVPFQRDVKAAEASAALATRSVTLARNLSESLFELHRRAWFAELRESVLKKPPTESPPSASLEGQKGSALAAVVDAEAGLAQALAAF